MTKKDLRTLYVCDLMAVQKQQREKNLKFLM